MDEVRGDIDTINKQRKIITILIITFVSVLLIIAGWAIFQALGKTSGGLIELISNPDLDIERAYLEEGNLNVQVQRNSRKDNFTGIQFNISDGETIKTIKTDVFLENKEEKTFAFSLTGLGLEDVTLVSVAPIYRVVEEEQEDISVEVISETTDTKIVSSSGGGGGSGGGSGDPPVVIIDDEGDEADTISPYFTTLENQTGYISQALSYDINAADNVALSSFSIDDTTNFSINSLTGVITNVTVLVEHYYVVNISINDTSGNLNWSLWGFNVTSFSSSPTCSDGIQNQDETGVDCGGVCGDCVEEADYYVAPWGDDSNNGSFDFPFFSLNEVWDVIQPGDLVYLRGGVYNFTDQQWLRNKNGVAENLIRIWAYPGETPILSRGETYTHPAYYCGIWFVGDYFHFKGLEISGYYQETSHVWTGFRAQDSNNNIFELLNVHHNGAGFLLRGNSGGNLILNSDFHHNQDPLTSYGNADGLQLAYIPSGNTNTVRGSRMWWNTDDGFDLWLNEGNVIIEDSWAWYNGYLPDTFDSAGDGSGFKLGKQDENHSSEILRTIINSIASHNRLAGFMDNGALSNMELYNNFAYKNAPSGGWAGGFHFNLPESEGIPYYIKNNIGYDNLPNELTANTFTNIDHNSWDGFTVTDGDFVSLDINQLMQPRKADGSLPDVTFGHLVEGSDLIDAGVNVGLPYEGSAPDIGAFEL